MKKTKQVRASYKITPREFQRGIFLASLRQQLNKVADAHSKIITAARDYSRDGLDENEVRELLLIDGYNPEVVTAAMERLAEEGDAGEQWGFRVESQGRIYSNADLGLVVTAMGVDDALEKTQELLFERGEDNAEILGVFRV